MQSNNNTPKPTTLNLPSVQFVGTYTPKGNGYYQNNDSNLLIKVCTRKQATVLKPVLYIVQRTEDNKYPFLTSLYPYPDKPGIYKAEIQRKYYVVNYSGETLNVNSL